jgi:UDP-glucose 4-epimerase
MRILVTGGSGFVGSHTVDALIARGHEPRVLDLVPPNRNHGSVDLRIGDVRDRRVVTDAVRGCDAVIHLAAVADVGRVLADPGHARRVNVDGTRHVLRAGARESVRRVLFASTVWVYGSSNGRPFVEDDAPPPPAHPYVAGKLTGEGLCRDARRLGLATTVARLGIPYGPRARPATVLATFVAQAADGRPVTVAGDGRQSRPFVYVEDLAEGIVTAALAPHDGTYNLAAAESVSVLALAETVRSLHSGAGPIRHTARRPGDVDALEVSSARAARELGWRPRVPLHEGVTRYIAWLAETNGTRAAAAASTINGTAAAVARQEPGAL